MCFLVPYSIVLLVNRWRYYFQSQQPVILIREHLVHYFSHIRLFQLQYFVMNILCLADNHYKIICGSFRSECSSCRVRKKNMADWMKVPKSNRVVVVGGVGWNWLQRVQSLRKVKTSTDGQRRICNTPRINGRKLTCRINLVRQQ